MEVNKTHFEDCYKVLLTMPDGCVDFMPQDTPFGCTQNEWDIKPDFDKMWPEWLRVGKSNCAFLFFAVQPFASELIMSMPKLFRYDIVWEKSVPVGFLNANKMPLRSHELILLFYRSLPTYNPQKTFNNERKVSKLKHKLTSKKSTNYRDYNLSGYDSTERFPTSVLKFAQDKQKSSLHPTQKPEALIRYLIKTYSNEGDLVFDGYAGSGTTAAASIKEGRNFIVCENNEKYFTDSENRINEDLKILQLF